MEFYERVSGARMHANFIRPGGISIEIPVGLLSDIQTFIKKFIPRIVEISDILNNSRI